MQSLFFKSILASIKPRCYVRVEVYNKLSILFIAQVPFFRKNCASMGLITFWNDSVCSLCLLGIHFRCNSDIYNVYDAMQKPYLLNNYYIFFSHECKRLM